jgi:hypothetical protein
MQMLDGWVALVRVAGREVSRKQCNARRSLFPLHASHTDNMQAFLQEFAAARAHDFLIIKAYAEGLLHSGGFNAPDDAQAAALVSLLLLATAVNVGLLLLLPKGRRVVFDTVETILAIALIIILLAVVLGLPLGELLVAFAACPAAWHVVTCTRVHARNMPLLLLSLRAGIIYLVLKAAAFLLNLLFGLPAISSLLTAIQRKLGLL